ncbi:hypothetical protein AH02_38 [Pseudomonas phage AH02]|nr:hypothetical protein AH02_38 [Pseudomonas phage AH02]
MLNNTCQHMLDEAYRELRDPQFAEVFELKFAATQFATQVLHMQGAMDVVDYRLYTNRLRAARMHYDALRARQVRLYQK